MRQKLIEVALPLAAINAASAREKSIRHGHPSTLHLWWARRPLATARAVLFAQLVDDPASWPDRFPTEAAQEQERQRLFRIIEELVRWENTTNARVLQAAREEIRTSWRRTCAEQAAHPRAAELFDPAHLPAFHDPFAGGGALPLEAQRLGLAAHASDLNPVAVLLNKAMLEIPPRFAGQPPVNPAWRAKRHEEQTLTAWTGAGGLAEDVRYYGQWMREAAATRIGQLYPQIEVTEAMAQTRPDLEPYVGRQLTVIAWLWARTVQSPNPAFAEVAVPLASTFLLSSKPGKEAYVEAEIEGCEYRFTVKVGTPPATAKAGTKLARGSFRCLLSQVPIRYEYIDAEANAGRMGERMMPVVAAGDQGRVYLTPTEEMTEVARSAKPPWKPATPSRGTWASNAQGRRYGFQTFGDYFTPRQLVALTTFCDLVGEVMTRVQQDAGAAGLADEDVPLREGGTGALAYAEAVGVYLAFAVDKGADYWSSICAWHNSREIIGHTFSRQAIPMVWDYSEANPLSESSGNFLLGVEQAAKLIGSLGMGTCGEASQQDATSQAVSSDKVVSTDPPYYDNIGYADLSDFFYVWLRRSLRSIFPELFATLAVPKAEELVATPYRHGGKERAEAFFLDGMGRAMQRLAEQTHPAFPVTIYYAFKQSEQKGDTGTTSTGWETFLEAVIQAGFSITGTWPMRTEYTVTLKKNVSALASSIVLVCRPRPHDAPLAPRGEFVSALRTELPVALTQLQAANIAPVDLAQAAIGPGMAVYTRYATVLDAQGNPVSVREALALINATLDEVLAEQEGDFDADSRWALAWFAQHGFTAGAFGVAETLSKAKNTSVAGLVEAGILESTAGRVRLLRPEELPADWDPSRDGRLPVWEAVHHLIRVLEVGGEEATAKLRAQLGETADLVRELCYRLYTLCERKGWAGEARAYNGLVTSWEEVGRLAGQAKQQQAEQGGLFGEE